MARDFGLFFAAAQAGYPYAMACSAYLLRESGEPRRAREMAARLVEARAGKPDVQENQTLDKVGQKSRKIGSWQGPDGGFDG